MTSFYYELPRASLTVYSSPKFSIAQKTEGRPHKNKCKKGRADSGLSRKKGGKVFSTRKVSVPYVILYNEKSVIFKVF